MTIGLHWRSRGKVCSSFGKFEGRHLRKSSSLKPAYDKIVLNESMNFAQSLAENDLNLSGNSETLIEEPELTASVEAARIESNEEFVASCKNRHLKSKVASKARRADRRSTTRKVEYQSKLEGMERSHGAQLVQLREDADGLRRSLSTKTAECTC